MGLTAAEIFLCLAVNRICEVRSVPCTACTLFCVEKKVLHAPSSSVLRVIHWPFWRKGYLICSSSVLIAALLFQRNRLSG